MMPTLKETSVDDEGCETWTCTHMLRWKKMMACHNDGMKVEMVLQQQWIEWKSGKTKWEDVPSE